MDHLVGNAIFFTFSEITCYKNGNSRFIILVLFCTAAGFVPFGLTFVSQNTTTSGQKWVSRTDAGISGRAVGETAVRERVNPGKKADLEEAESKALFGEVFRDMDSISSFRSSLIDWFREEGRDYPWRNTSDPYAILVSELMLQQTRIATVLERDYFGRWMRLFPDVKALAAAGEDEILKAWEGLGYYNRARNLQKAAREVVGNFDANFPESLENIESLPGVGRYTAGAVFSFAFDRRAPIVDGNVIRVFARLFGYAKPVDTPKAVRVMWDWADRLTPDSAVRAYNSAIMELGQRICTRASPDCGACPVRNPCRAESRGIAGQLPQKRGKAEITQKKEYVGLFIENGKILLEEESGSRRRGLWKLPQITENQSIDWEELFRFPYSITRYRVEMIVFRAPPGAGNTGKSQKWYPLSDGENLPALGSPYRKAIRKYLDLRDDLMMNR